MGRSPAHLLVVALAACGRFGIGPLEGDAGDDAADAAAGGDATDGDADDDGVLDADDNCPFVANAGQHDEDADQRGDPCDNCPGRANADQADALEAAPDGVGDVCDPRPTLGGDAIVRFDPFTGNALDPRWIVQSGTWTVGNDQLAQTASGSDRRLYDGGITDADIVVETRVTFTSFEANDDRNAGVIVRLDPAAGNGWLGAVFLDQTGAVGALKLWVLAGGSAGMFTEVSIAPPVVGSSYVVSLAGVGSTITARVTSGAQGQLVRMDMTGAAGPPGLRVHRAQATYEYFAVYRVAGALP